MSKENSSFLGNQNLKKAGTPVTFTQFQMDEYKKCMVDPIYFIKNYMKIVHVDRGLIPFEMWDFQEDLVQLLHDERYVVGKLSRQIGKSTCVVGYFLWLSLFSEHQVIGILAHKGDVARELLGRYRLAYEHLPPWLQQGIVNWNKGSIELENGSRIIASSTTGSAIRGFSFTAILLDEFAFVQKGIAEEFFTSVYPTISSGETTKLFIISTPKGLNQFYQQWMDAVNKKSKFITFEAFWHQVPGRDEKWKADQIKNSDERKFAQEHGCDFIGSSLTLISGDKLKVLLASIVTPIRSEAGLDIYEMPEVDREESNHGKWPPMLKIPGHTYALMVDVAHGIGQDYSAFSVIDVTEIPYKQVAKYRDNNISPLLYPTHIYNVAKLYNDAFVLVEISDIGQQIADILHYELEYDNLVKVQSKGKQGQIVSPGHQKKVQFGVKTSHATKRAGCGNLKTLIESDKLLLRDADTISELTTFTEQNDTFKAEEGCHDDLVMTLVFFGWFISQRHFRDGLKRDIRSVLQHEHLNIVEEDVIPFGFIDNHHGGDMYDEPGTMDWDKYLEEKQIKNPFDSQFGHEEIDYISIDWQQYRR